MLTSKLRANARFYARGSTALAASASSSTEISVNDLINDAIRQFSNDVGGVPKHDYLTIAEKFDLRTTMAIRLTITGSTNNNIAATDIALTTTNASDQTGAQVATTLQARLRAAIGGGSDLTVTWTDYYFTLSPIQASAVVTIEAPTGVAYSDATGMIFGGTGSVIGDYVGGFPHDCTWEAALPTGIKNVSKVEWDQVELCAIPREQMIRGQGSSSTPSYYNIRGDKLYLYPSPSKQGELYIEYKGLASTVTSFETNVDTAIPEEYQKALEYWVAAELLKAEFEEERAQTRYAEYRRLVSKYVCDLMNRDTASPRSGGADPARLPRVITT